MSKLKKGLATITIAAGMLLLPLAAFADKNTDIQVSASVSGTPSVFQFNFDGITFSGSAGKVLEGKATLNGNTTSIASYRIESLLNFSTYVSGSNLSSSSGKILNSQRITVAQYQGAYDEWHGNDDYDYSKTDPSYAYYTWQGDTKITDKRSLLYSGSAWDQNDYTFTRNLKFSLDLKTGYSNYGDDEVLAKITETEQFNSSITFSYTGL